MTALGGSELLKNYHVALGAEMGGLQSGLASAAQLTDKAVGQIEAKTSGLGAAIKSIGDGIAKAMRAGVAIVVPVTGAIGALKAAVVAEERANARLARSISMVEGAAADTIPTINKLADEIDRYTTLSENQIKTLAAHGATLGGLAGAELEQATAAAVGLAAKYEHVGLTRQQAMRMIAQAGEGDFSGFKRLGIDLDGIADGHEKYNEIMRIGLDGLRDSAEQAGKFSGQLNRLWDSVSELAAAGGRLIGLSAEGSPLLETIIELVEKAADKLDDLKPKVDEFYESVKEMLGVGSFSDLFDLDIAKLELDRLVDQILTRIDLIATNLENKLRQALNRGIEAIPDWVRDLASDTVDFFSGDTKRKELKAQIDILQEQKAHVLERGTKLALEGGTEAEKERNAEALQRIVRQLRAVRAELDQTKGNVFESGLHTLSPEEIRRNSEEAIAALAERDAAIKAEIERLSQDKARAREEKDKEREKALEDAINRLNEVETDPSLGLKKDGAKVVAQSIQTAIGNLRIPGQVETAEALQKSQLKQQKKANDYLRIIAERSAGVRGGLTLR